MGWIIALIYRNLPLSTILYFTIYSLLIRPIFFILYKINRKTLAQLNSSSNKYKLQFIVIPVIFLSLGGLPPLTGFFPKWLTIYLISPESFLLLIFLIIGSLINLYFYLNIVFSSILRKNIINSSWNINILISAPSLVFAATICLPLVPLLII
jgi:NADH:ubiquinone oxidoreductase subunit 2 (subunit N)